MTTVLVIGDSETSRRCDAHCHDSHEPRCACICGGRYHGQGRRALDLVQHDIEHHLLPAGTRIAHDGQLTLEAAR